MAQLTMQTMVHRRATSNRLWVWQGLSSASVLSYQHQSIQTYDKMQETSDKYIGGGQTSWLKRKDKLAGVSLQAQWGSTGGHPSHTIRFHIRGLSRNPLSRMALGACVSFRASIPRLFRSETFVTEFPTMWDSETVLSHDGD